MKWSGVVLALALGGRAWGMAQEPTIGVSLAGYTHSLSSGALTGSVTFDVTQDPGAGNTIITDELACSNSPLQWQPDSGTYDTSAGPVVVLKGGLSTATGTFQVTLQLDQANVGAVVFQEGVAIYFAALLECDTDDGGGALDPAVGMGSIFTLSASLQLIPDASPPDPAVVTVLGASASSVTLGWFEPADHVGTLIQDAAVVDLRYSSNPIVTDGDFNAASPVSGIAPHGHGTAAVQELGGLSSSTQLNFAIRFGDGSPHNNWSPRSNSVMGSTLAYVAGASGSSGGCSALGRSGALFLVLHLGFLALRNSGARTR